MNPRILLAAKQKKENYAEAVKACGGIPILEYNPEELDGFAGLILCGGNDIDPDYYGEPINGSVNIDRERDAAEFALAKAFLKAGKPVLGICRGYQLLNILFGGTLHQHIETAGMHQANENGDMVHPVIAKSGSIVAGLYGERFMVNSSHHQAVKMLGEGLLVTMKSEDGVIEGFEHKSLAVFGVQWHPERMCCAHRRADTVDGIEIFRYFMDLVKGGSEHEGVHMQQRFSDTSESPIFRK